MDGWKGRWVDGMDRENKMSWVGDPICSGDDCWMRLFLGARDLDGDKPI